MTKTTDTTETARAYYAAIDSGDYDRFADLLRSGVVHERPDRTIEGRDALVGFMREDRPQKDTSHEVDAVYRNTDHGDGGSADGDTGVSQTEVAVRGRLCDAEGSPMFSFVDVFDVECANENQTERITRIRTYTQ